ncbi:MAG: PAS domain S-box protein [Cyanobacteria bacterium P01_G01_bin.19]
MSIEPYLQSNFKTVAPNSLLKDAIASSYQKSLDCMLVISEGLAGIITKSDLVKAIATGVDVETATVAKIMTQPVIAVADWQCQDLQAVRAMFQQHSISHLPVVNQNRELLGVINAKTLALVQIEDHNKQPECDRDWQHQARELERFFELTPSMLCVAGFDGYFKRLNSAFEATLGYDKSELLAKPFLDFIHPEDRAATQREVAKLAAGDTTISFENRYQTKAGDYRWLLWTAKAYLQDEIIYAAARDISDRKQSELALTESEERWQLALKGANDGIWDWNVKTNEVFFSRRWKEMLGFAEDEVDNTLDEWSKRVHPDDIGWVTRVIQEHFAGKTPFYVSEHRVLCKDGSYKWILDRGQALWDEAGNVVRMTGSHSDITQRIQVELQLQQERDFSNAVIDTVGALIAILDCEGRIVRFNRTCERVTGYGFAEIEGERVWDILITPKERSAVKAVFQRLLVGQIPNQYENYWQAKDGTSHLISWSNTALLDSEGKVEFIIATGIDVTEQRRVWNRLERQYRQTKLLAEIGRKIRMSIEIKDILQTAVTEVQHLLLCDRVLIVKIQSNRTALPISEAVLPDLIPMLGYELADPLLIGKQLAHYRQGEVLAIDNLATAAIHLDIKQLLQQFQVRAELVVPILSQQELKGLLIAHQCHNSRQWQESEVELLKQLADQIGVALSHALLLDNLEELVAQRTSELSTTNQLLEEEITERRQTEVTLKENQQKLSGILDNADEAIISVDERYRIQLFNQGAEKIFGYQAEQVIEQPLDVLLPKAFRQVHHQHIFRFSESDKSSQQMAQRNNKVFGLRKNGQKFPAEASISKLQTREGLLFTVMLQDITDRQQTLVKLEASKALLTKAEQIAKIGSWEYNHQTQQASWSDELFAILGFDCTHAIPDCETIMARVHPEDRLLVRKTLRQGHHQGVPWNLNYRLLLPDGTLKYVESRGEATFDAQGKILKVLETIMDVSDRVRAEQSWQRSEQQLRLITDALPVLIAYIDRQERYRYINRTYETWYGKPCSHIIGKPMTELWGENNYHKLIPYIKTVLAGKAVTFESQPSTEKGNSYWISAVYIPDLDANGKVKGFFSLVDDITERKITEQLKSEFVSIASHEMRTPLTSIHGVIKLLAAGRLGELSESGIKMAQMAMRNSDRLVRLINDILDLERLESGRDKIDKQICNSKELIQQAIDLLRPMAVEQNIALEIDATAIEFMGDRDRLIQTLTNLIGNAIKFSSAKSTVWVTSRSQKQNVLFSVRDTGRGIPQDKLESIFERFQQVDASDSREKGGTGLGLAICRHIVEQHEGRIWAESVFGEGSTFYFAIPK